MIAGTGTLLNAGTVVAGGTIGSLWGNRIPLRVRHAAIAVLGLFTCVLGIETVLVSSFPGHPAPDAAIVLIGLLVGTAVGAGVGIDSRLAGFGRWLERRMQARGGRAVGSPGQALLTTSLLFCVGPLTVLGAYEDGSHGDILLLGIKSALDGVAALAFAATLGPGVLLSAITVVVVQGSLTLAAFVTRGALDPFLATQALGAGGVMLLGIGIGLLDIRRLPVADMLPALLVAPLAAALLRALHWQV